MDVNKTFEYMLGAFLIIVLAFTWFFPTVNGTTAINNASTLWLGGTNYSWAVPIISVVLIISIVYMIWKGFQGG